MKKFFILFIILIFKSHSLYAQEKHVFNPKINKDSLYSKLEYMIPDAQKKEYREMFSKADDGGKEYVLIIMYNGQKGGKKYLIDIFEAHKMQIMKLHNQDERPNSSNYIVTVSYDNNVLYIPSTHITITIHKIKEGYLNDEILDRNANLDYIGTYSGTNEKALDVLRWNNKVLNEIISLIKDANVISIRNGNPVQIEVHPNFSAMYSYKIYRKNLNKQQILEYNDGCSCIHYKDNIVLHNGAPSGVLCFEK